jgi:hypothetical protein
VIKIKSVRGVRQELNNVRVAYENRGQSIIVIKAGDFALAEEVTTYLRSRNLALNDK